MENICKRFGNTTALDKVSLKVEEGSIHALMGENGAGKSTLMKCLFGVYRKDMGIVRLKEKEINFCKTAEKGYKDYCKLIQK